ncbi:MAG: HipA domain-containing protein [Myxococcota bacterium]
MTDLAIVHLHGERVGTLERLNEFQDYRFSYDPGYLAGRSRPTLGQLFMDRAPGPIETSGMLSWFAHLLPGGPWRRHLERWAKLPEGEDDDLALLCAIGHDLSGAVTIEAAREIGRFRPIYAKREAPEKGAIRFSLAGAQWKLSVRRDEGGLAVPVHDEQGHYIAKFADPRHPLLPVVEWSVTEWARRAGLDVHHASLESMNSFEELPEGIPTHEAQWLCLTRFDRGGEDRVHIEDFAQVSDRPPTQIYAGTAEELAALVAALCPEDGPELLRRLVFMVASGNGDAHLKNWSLIYRDRRTPRLSPAYDLVSTRVYLGADDLAVQLSGTRAFEGVNADSFDRVGRQLGWEAQRTRGLVRETADSIVTQWQNERNQLPLPAWARDAIDKQVAAAEQQLGCAHK